MVFQEVMGFYFCWLLLFWYVFIFMEALFTVTMTRVSPMK